MHLHEERANQNGCIMKIVEYTNNRNIVVEFQDEYKATVKTSYGNFKRGIVRNPYYPTVCGVGISGNKYPIMENNKPVKEYSVWRRMLERCFDETTKEKQPTYKDVTCCSEWLYYDNFYKWIHSQSNFLKWHDEDRWAVDKDILVKGNKIYSPETCCLVPQNVNCLFLKREAERGQLPIGVKNKGNKFEANCMNPFTGKRNFIGLYKTPIEAFDAYKDYKENLIKQIAEIEYNNGNITDNCYNAMMSYIVEIND